MTNEVNRRDFLKSTAVAGGGVALPGGLQAPEGPTRVTPPTETRTIQTLENEHMRVQVFSDGVLDVLDKARGRQWTSYSVAIQDETVVRDSMLWGRRERAMGEQYPGRFIGEAVGDHVRFQLYRPQNVLVGAFRCRFRLKGPWLEVEILEVDDTLPSLVYPPPFESEALVLPGGGGRLVRNDNPSIYSGIYSRRFLQFFDELPMRFVAGLRGDDGWLCAYDLDSVDAGGMLVNGQVAPVWLRSLGQWQGRYRVFYGFTGNGYVGIAKRFRQYAMENGLFKSLREKLGENPEAGKLLGGRALQFMNFKSKGYPETRENYWATEAQMQVYNEDHILFTFDDVIEKVAIARERMGFQKGMVLLRGWMHGGYDSTHPDIWPVEERLGGQAGLEKVMALRDQYLTVLHDNYQDYYPTTPSFPNGVVVRENGMLMSGGMWFGKQCYITNSRDGARFAQRNWERVKALGCTGYFVDTTPCNPLHESYEKGNELTRRQDMQGKHDVLKVFYDAGQVVGSEKFGDFCVPVMHWSEHNQGRVPGETIPLWQLVFHDAVFGCRYSTFDPGVPYPSWLEDMLYGNFLRFWAPANFGGDEPYECDYVAGWGRWRYSEDEFKSTYHVDEWHGKVGLEEMTSHAVLTDDGQVEEAVYGDDLRITVNFSAEEKVVDGRTLKPHGYLLEG